MKPIVLSHDQSQQLLEMVNFFFPEHRVSQGRSENIVITHDGKVRIYMKTDNILRMVDIPWFEFCFTWLSERVFNPNPAHPQRDLKYNITSFFWTANMWWSEVYCPNAKDVDTGVEHPIDYLYACYLKIR